MAGTMNQCGGIDAGFRRSPEDSAPHERGIEFCVRGGLAFAPGQYVYEHPVRRSLRSFASECGEREFTVRVDQEARFGSIP